MAANVGTKRITWLAICIAPKINSKPPDVAPASTSGATAEAP
jgi:hypothetical protein